MCEDCESCPPDKMRCWLILLKIIFRTYVLFCLSSSELDRLSSVVMDRHSLEADMSSVSPSAIWQAQQMTRIAIIVRDMCFIKFMLCKYIHNCQKSILFVDICVSRKILNVFTASRQFLSV